MIIDKRIPFYYVLNKIKFDLIVVFIVGLLTNLFTILFHPLLPDMPLSIPALLGTSISILLSFKMNQSYDRWWEARKVWGAIVNDSRSLVIQLQAFLQNEDEEHVRSIAYRQIAWCHVLGKSLRGLNTTEGIEVFLKERDQLKILKHNNKPLAIIQLNAEELRELRRANRLEVFTHIQLDNTITRLIDSMGRQRELMVLYFQLHTDNFYILLFTFL